MMDEASMMRRRLGGCCFGGSDTGSLTSPSLSDNVTWNKENKATCLSYCLSLSLNMSYKSEMDLGY